MYAWKLTRLGSEPGNFWFPFILLFTLMLILIPTQKRKASIAFFSGYICTFIFWYLSSKPRNGHIPTYVFNMHYSLYKIQNFIRALEVEEFCELSIRFSFYSLWIYKTLLTQKR
jgi:hypothetical protein